MDTCLAPRLEMWGWLYCSLPAGYSMKIIKIDFICFPRDLRTRPVILQSKGGLLPVRHGLGELVAVAGVSAHLPVHFWAYTEVLYERTRAREQTGSKIFGNPPLETGYQFRELSSLILVSPLSPLAGLHILLSVWPITGVQITRKERNSTHKEYNVGGIVLTDVELWFKDGL